MSNHFQSDQLPAAISLEKYRRQQLLLREQIACGLSLVGESLTLVLHKSEDSATTMGKPLAAMTGLGVFYIYGYRHFFQLLTGVPLIEGVDHSHDLFRLLSARLPELIQKAFGFFEIIQAPEDPAGEVAALQIKATDVSQTAFLQASADVWQALLDKNPWQALVDSHKKTLPVAISVNAGTLTIDVNELQSLQKGDVLLIEAPCFDTQGVGSVQVGDDFFLPVRFLQRQGNKLNFEVGS